MTWLVSLMGAAGLVVFLSGLPGVRRVGLRSRTEPFLSGLRDRVGGFVIDRPVTSERLPRAIRRVLPDADPALEDRLRAAGSELSPDGFRIEQLVWGAAALIGVVLLAAAGGVARVQIDLRALPVLAGIAVVSGALARDWYLTKQGHKRTGRLIEELPTAIDLLTLSIMSGESVPSACERVGRTLGPGIGAEFTATVADMRAGAATASALEGLARRIPDPATARLIDSLIVAIERGAPLGDVLRAQADDCREARRRSLLELGGRREVLMLVPVVFLIMPVVVVFALMPGLVALDLLVP